MFNKKKKRKKRKKEAYQYAQSIVTTEGLEEQMEMYRKMEEKEKEEIIEEEPEKEKEEAVFEEEGEEEEEELIAENENVFEDEAEKQNNEDNHDSIDALVKEVMEKENNEEVTLKFINPILPLFAAETDISRAENDKKKMNFYLFNF